MEEGDEWRKGRVEGEVGGGGSERGGGGARGGVDWGTGRGEGWGTAV